MLNQMTCYWQPVHRECFCIVDRHAGNVGYGYFTWVPARVCGKVTNASLRHYDRVDVLDAHAMALRQHPVDATNLRLDDQ